MDVTSCFYPHNILFTSVVFLTIHDTLMIHVDNASLSQFFLRWSQMLLTQCDLRSAPNVNVLKNSNKRGQTAGVTMTSLKVAK